MKTVALISIVLFISYQCIPCRSGLVKTISVGTLEENEVYINFSHDSLFLSYYFSDKESIEDAIIDSVVIDIPKFGKSMKVVTDRSPIHSRLFLGKSDKVWEETGIVVFFWKDGFKTDKYDLKL